MERRRPLKDIIKDMAKLSILLYLVGVVFTAIGYGIYLLNIKELLWEAYRFITDICNTPLGMIFVMPAVTILIVMVVTLIAGLFVHTLTSDFINPQDIIDRQRSIKGE